jgi:hypothetical protein
MIKIFISHSSRDADLAEAIVNLLRNALNILPEDIRCTSVDGYRLPAGVGIDEQLRNEVSESEIFVALLSKASLQSSYVMFELGARWGIKKHLFPLLVPGLDPSNLRGPVATLNSLKCDSHAQMEQFIHEVSLRLDLASNPPASYYNMITKLTGFTQTNPSETITTNSDGQTIDTLEGKPVFTDNVINKKIESEIKEKAASEYPNDFSTQRYVVQQQSDAYKQLVDYHDPNIPENIMLSILADARTNYPSDYLTQIHVVKSQIKDWKELNDS